MPRPRGHWPRGRRRGGIDGAAELLSRIGTVSEVARAAGVSPRAVSWWLTGRKAPSLETLWRVIDHFLPPQGGRESAFHCVSGGISETTLTAGTPCGVGQYTLQAAEGRRAMREMDADGE